MTRNDAGALRIGCVKYLNAQPLILGWPGDVVFDHPAELCRMLAEGELDVALVSSFEFLRNPVYSIADDVAVATAGAVYSVFVAHEGRIEDIEKIALDPASNTSVNLLRCLLAELGIFPRFLGSTDDAVVRGTQGRLVIGDQAIRFRQNATHDVRIWDLGAQWHELTRLPFVFALWLIRPGVENASGTADALRRLRDDNVAALDQLIAAQTEFSPEFCRFYFHDCLRFSFAEDEKRGLLLFRSLCEKHRILPPNAAPLRLI